MNWKRRMTRDDADRLLEGAGDGEVARVVNAARAPGSNDELAREDTMALMFQAVRLTPTADSRGALMPNGPIKRLAAFKVALLAAVAVLFASSGLALAATQHLPWQASPNSAASSPNTDESSDPGDATGEGTDPADHKTPGEGETAKGDDEGGEGDGDTDEDSDEAPGDDSGEEPKALPGAKGLCRAYFSGNKGEHGSAFDSPAFQSLIEAAGGVENVEAYCLTLGVEPKPGNGKGKPDEGGDKSGNGKGKPDEGGDKSGNGNDKPGNGNGNGKGKPVDVKGNDKPNKGQSSG